MEKIKITKKQKKIFMIVGIVGIAFFVFIAVIYLPLRNEAMHLKRELYAIESEISLIKKSIGETKPLEEAIGSLKDRYDELSRMFPEKEEVVLRELAGSLAKFGAEVTSIRPQKKRVIKDIDGVPVKISGYYAQEMVLSISLKTSYKTLGEFFKTLKTDFPIFVRVDSVNMTKASGASPGLLDVELNLDTYLVCPEAL